MAKRFPLLATSLVLLGLPKRRIFCHDHINAPSFPHREAKVPFVYQKAHIERSVDGFGFRVGIIALAPFRFAYLTSLSIVLLASSPVYLISATTYEKLVHWTLSRSGPTVTKLAQWVSARRDLPVPEIVRNAVNRVVDQARMHSDQYSLDLIKKRFGDEKFELVECVGSGAIGQVYRALWNDTPVAIKVRHPWVETLIYVDLALLETAAAVLNWFPGMHWLSLPEEVALFRHMMQEQLDFRIEAQHLETFRRNFAHNTSTTVFPKPIYPFVTEDVLVEEWMPGCPVWKVTNGGSESLRKKVAAYGLDAFLHMMLFDNFIHADLHPGNILVQLHNPETNEAIVPDLSKNIPDGFEPRLVFLDVGLTTSLSPHDLVNLTDLLSAILANNGSLAAELMMTRAPTTSSSAVVDPEGFQQGLSVLLKDTFKRSFHLRSFYVSQTLSRLFSLIRKHHVKLDPAFTNLLVSLMVIEGLGRQLDSEIDVLESARKVLRKKEKSDLLKQDSRNVVLKVMGVLEVRAWWRSEWTPEWEIIDTLLTNV